MGAMKQDTEYRSKPYIRQLSTSLSTREIQVVTLGEHCDCAETASVLGISVKTVDAHRAAIKRKLLANTWTHAVVLWRGGEAPLMSERRIQ